MTSVGRGLAAALTATLATAATARAACPPPSEAARPSAEAAARTLTVTFLGVSTLVFDDGERQLLVDGYFSRPGPLRTLFLPIGPDGGRVEAALARAGVRRLDAVLTAHAHHDHALDTAYIARKHTEAAVVGDAAVGALALSRGVRAGQVCVPSPGRAHEFGPYRVTAFLTRHGETHPVLHRLLDRELKTAFRGPAWFGRYRDPENLSFRIEHGGRSILVHPSAGQPDYPRQPADVVFLGVGGLAKVERRAPGEIGRYWTATVDPKARLVVPIHWDAFWSPLSAGPPPPPAWLDDVDATIAALGRRATGLTRVVPLKAYQAVVMTPGQPPSVSDAPRP